MEQGLLCQQHGMLLSGPLPYLHREEVPTAPKKPARVRLAGIAVLVT